jgi:hypothetical protein
MKCAPIVSARAPAGREPGTEEEFVADVSCAVRLGSWSIEDLPGFRVILFARAKVRYAAGAAPSSPS